MVPALSCAAVAAGADGLLIEVHPCPPEAWCDADQALTPDEFATLMVAPRCRRACDRAQRGDAFVHACRRRHAGERAASLIDAWENGEIRYNFKQLHKQPERMTLAKSFEPHAIEMKWYPVWEARGYFAPAWPPGAPAYCIPLPPPNVTGTLHMGHAFQQTLMDILIRYHRMRG